MLGDALQGFSRRAPVTHRFPPSARRRTRGLTLVELLVASLLSVWLIGLLLLAWRQELGFQRNVNQRLGDRQRLETFARLLEQDISGGRLDFFIPRTVDAGADGWAPALRLLAIASSVDRDQDGYADTPYPWRWMEYRVTADPLGPTGPGGRRAWRFRVVRAEQPTVHPEAGWPGGGWAVAAAWEQQTPPLTDAEARDWAPAFRRTDAGLFWRAWRFDGASDRRTPIERFWRLHPSPPEDETPAD